jgi:polyphosphate kinase 2 (PPK2 family)
VIVTRVHPEIITKYQRLPQKFDKESDIDKIFEERYKDINNFETYLTNNGFRIIKFFLNVSKKEQKRRFLER